MAEAGAEEDASVSESAFTRGPWHRRIGREGNGQPASQHEQICNENGRSVTMLEHDGSEEAEANAVLISAAPSLYRALYRILFEHAALSRRPADCLEDNCCYCEGRAALKKARGEK